MKYFRMAIQSVLRVIFKMKARNQISRLFGKTNGSSTLLMNALRESLHNYATPEEKTWIDKIELLRKKLDSSTTEVSIVDYGAGKSGINITDEEMSQGRSATVVIGDVCRRASKPMFWSIILFRLIREFKPLICLELGTCIGISGSYQAAALKLNQIGKFITLEGAEPFATLAQRNFKSLGLDNVSVIVGRIGNNLDSVLKEYRPIDYVFIDAHHDEKATMNYFEQIVPFLSDRALLVFDDISWSEGMKKAWKRIESDERVKISIDLWKVGICMIDRGIEGKQRYKIPLI